MDRNKIELAAQLLRDSEFTVAFTGAGISVESGVPPFRGPDGIWSKIDPKFADISFFLSRPKDSWPQLKSVFFDHIGKAEPNMAHYCLAKMERTGLVQAIITQNIDNLHQKAGSVRVVEFHGNTRFLVCMDCGKRHPVTDQLLQKLPPKCHDCGGLLKPDFVFFGEPIPSEALLFTKNAVRQAEVWLVIGTSGEVYPASLFPKEAKDYGAKLIEINIKPSNYTEIADLFLQGKASAILTEICKKLGTLPETD